MAAGSVCHTACCHLARHNHHTPPSTKTHAATTPRTPPETKTSTFDLRVDYILPSRSPGLDVVGGGVFWPVRSQQPQVTWVTASDHRPVFMDVRVCTV